MRLSNELVYNGALKCGSQKTADNRLCLPEFSAISPVSSSLPKVQQCACICVQFLFNLFLLLSMCVIQMCPAWLHTTLSPDDGKEVVFLNVDDIISMTQRGTQITPKKKEVNSGVQSYEEACVVQKICQNAILVSKFFAFFFHHFVR